MRFYPRKEGKNLRIGEKINFFMYGHAVISSQKFYLANPVECLAQRMAFVYNNKQQKTMRVRICSHLIITHDIA